MSRSKKLSYEAELYNALNWEGVKAFVKGKDPKEMRVGFAEDWDDSVILVYKRRKGWIKKRPVSLVSYWGTPSFEAVMDNGLKIRQDCIRRPTDAEVRKGKQDFNRETRGRLLSHV